MAKKLTLEQQLIRAQQTVPDIRKRLKARIPHFIADEVALADAKRSRGTAKGGGQSSKQKGRAVVLLVKQLLHAAYPMLQDDDVVVKTTSQGGCDVHLSPRAQYYFPYGIEAKGSESLSIWAALRQAELNAARAQKRPILFFKRAHTAMYVALRADDFFQGSDATNDKTAAEK